MGNCFIIVFPHLDIKILDLNIDLMDGEIINSNFANKDNDLKETQLTESFQILKVMQRITIQWLLIGRI